MMTAAKTAHSARGQLRNLGAYVGLGVGAIIVVAPFVWTVYASFVKSDLDVNSLNLVLGRYGLTHYSELLTGSLIGRWWLNSLLVTALIVAGNLVFNTAAGYALARLSFPGRGALFGLVLATMMIPSQVLFVPIYTMVVSLGWLNSYAGLIVPFLINPFGVFLMRQHFIGFPQELDDAGRIDGLGSLGVFRHVALPNAVAWIAAQAIFIFVWNWNTFVFPSVLVTRPEMFTLPVCIYQLTHTAFTNHVALSMAGVVLTTVPSLLIFALLQRRFVHALTGAIKG